MIWTARVKGLARWPRNRTATAAAAASSPTRTRQYILPSLLSFVLINPVAAMNGLTNVLWPMGDQSMLRFNVISHGLGEEEEKEEEEEEKGDGA